MSSCRDSTVAWSRSTPLRTVVAVAGVDASARAGVAVPTNARPAATKADAEARMSRFTAKDKATPCRYAIRGATSTGRCDTWLDLGRAAVRCSAVGPRVAVPLTRPDVAAREGPRSSQVSGVAMTT